MRWLNGRGRQERGAVAVVVAICMVVLMGFLAIAVDVGSIYSDKQQLQNGADAGALAIAESCQRGSCIDTANKYVMANKLDGQAIGTAVINQTAGSVTVEATSTHQNWFAGVLGKDLSTTTIRAQAIATYGSPLAGPTLPLTFSWCVFHDATGGWDDASGNALSSATVRVYLREPKTAPPAAPRRPPSRCPAASVG
jgi:Flp pilus assembly protein TadG